MAGSEEQNPSMTTAQLVTLIKQVGRKPVERGTLYNVIRDYSDIEIKEIESNPLLN
jgi:aminodeoxyfutalosine synthase